MSEESQTDGQIQDDYTDEERERFERYLDAHPTLARSVERYVNWRVEAHDRERADDDPTLRKQGGEAFTVEEGQHYVPEHPLVRGNPRPPAPRSAEAVEPIEFNRQGNAFRTDDDGPIESTVVTVGERTDYYDPIEGTGEFVRTETVERVTEQQGDEWFDTGITRVELQGDGINTLGPLATFEFDRDGRIVNCAPAAARYNVDLVTRATAVFLDTVSHRVGGDVHTTDRPLVAHREGWDGNSYPNEPAAGVDRNSEDGE